MSIWQGFRIPTLLQQGVQFTGASHFFGSVRGLFKKGGLGHAIEKGNEDIRAYVTGESNRFGGSQVDEWIKRIEDGHYNGRFPVEKYPGFAGIMQQYMFYSAIV